MASPRKEFEVPVPAAPQTGPFWGDPIQRVELRGDMELTTGSVGSLSHQPCRFTLGVRSRVWVREKRHMRRKQLHHVFGTQKLLLSFVKLFEQLQTWSMP